jgi:hypothetical protein
MAKRSKDRIGVHFVLSKVPLLKKVALIYCNTMLVASATTQTQEIVCEDINDFIKYDHHYSRLVDETMLDVQTKQYGTVTVVSSIHVS